MGGFGSGRSAQKATFDEGLHLDLDKLIRDGLVRPDSQCSGSLIWRVVETGRQTAPVSYTARLDVDTGTGELNVTYRVTDWRGDRHDIDEHVPLEGVAQRYGGRRWYFLCPVTGRRCRKLYLLPGGRRFAARQAWRACYRSQQKVPYERAIGQAQKLRRRLGASLCIGDEVPKPSGMHWHTFDRHLDRLERYEARVDAGLLLFVERFRRRGL
jgi:hypothetical protein